MWYNTPLSSVIIVEAANEVVASVVLVVVRTVTATDAFINIKLSITRKPSYR